MSKSPLEEIRQVMGKIRSANARIGQRLEKAINRIIEGGFIERSFYVDPHFLMPALSLVHFSARVLEFLHPEKDFRFTVEQCRGDIRVIIECKSEDKLPLEESLELYGRVLRGQEPLNKLLSNEAALMELKHTLDLSALELSIRLGRDISALDNPVAVDFKQISTDVSLLHQRVGDGLSALYEVRQLIHKLLEEEEDLVSGALKEIQGILDEPALVPEAEEALRLAFKNVHTHQPDMIETIRETLNRLSTSGEAGDHLYSWITGMIKLLPQ